MDHKPSPGIPEGFHFIAHLTDVQPLFDKMDITWGVQYELARGVCCGQWTWSDITCSVLENLRGILNKSTAPRIQQSFPWRVTTEVAHIDLREVWPSLNSPSGSNSIVLIPGEMCAIWDSDLAQFFAQKFILVFLMETNIDHKRKHTVHGDNKHMSLEDFLALHNPMMLNGDQEINLYPGRLRLNGLHNSVLDWRPQSLLYCLTLQECSTSKMNMLSISNLSDVLKPPYVLI
ncbi:hypothetical protein C8Q78DRAFT_992922 [Trametes maxima]|nr:hypothetical protein C8Q78DRAFT_992922 [Trametes maxima]